MDIQKVEPKGFPGSFNVGSERRKGDSRVTPRLLAQAIERLELPFPERGNLCGLHGF